MNARVTYEDWAAVSQTNPIAQQMELATLSCLAVLDGQFPVAYLSGPPGVGKNHAVLAALQERGVAHVVRANPSNYKELLQQFDTASQQGAPLWLDEADVIFRTDRMLNLLKAATDTDPRNRVYNGQRVNVPIFVTTNQPLASSKLAEWWKPELLVHARALFSRSTPIVISEDRHDLWEYAVFLAQTSKLIRVDPDGDGIPVAVRNEALTWFTTNLHRLDTVSPRTLKTIADDMNRSRRGRLNPRLVQHKLANMLTQTSADATPPIPEIVFRRAAA